MSTRYVVKTPRKKYRMCNNIDPKLYQRLSRNKDICFRSFSHSSLKYVLWELTSRFKPDTYY